MSRIGKKPIAVPAGVEVKVEAGEVFVKGPKGNLSQKIHPLVKVEVQENNIVVTVKNEEDSNEKALWGLFRSLVYNMVEGVTNGFSKKLEINGVGYKAAINGKVLLLNVGYSHPVEFLIPDNLECTVEKNIITITGIDKQIVGEVAANIRKIRKPEPYKGKGIKYVDEVLRRKAGKAGKAAA